MSELFIKQIIWVWMPLAIVPKHLGIKVHGCAIEAENVLLV